MPIENKNINESTETESTESKQTAKVIDENARIIVDVRTVEEYEEGAVPDALNIPLDELTYRYEELGKNTQREIIVYCASGARSAYAQQLLRSLGYSNVSNGGGLAYMMSQFGKAAVAPNVQTVNNEPLVVDVRTPQEFKGGAYPNAINIQLDELANRVDELGSKQRDITLYCASGARSAYAQRMLQQMGFSNVKNGGGLMHMMMRR